MIVKNLDLVLKNVEKELKAGYTRETKTLMNTYLNLLSQYKHTKFDLKDGNVNEFLSNHHSVLNNCLNDAHEKVSSLLESYEYKAVDNIAQITQRIESALLILKNMQNEYKKFMNLPQNLVKVQTGTLPDGRPKYKLAPKYK